MAQMSTGDRILLAKVLVVLVLDVVTWSEWK